MALVSLRDVSVGFGGPPLLDGLSCQIEAGQRVGVVGRNGVGKTTLLRLLSGEIEPESGEVVVASSARVSLLPQEVPRDLTGPAADVVASGLELGDDGEARWSARRRVESMLSRMDLEGAPRFETLSSGMKRRVLLARAMVSDPDLLCLDEPTNHLDIDAIRWLEEFLLRRNLTLLFVTHDRTFLGRVADRILEIDRGLLFDWSCDYETFLVRRDALLAAREREEAEFDRKLAREEAWIRRGIKARRTRNQGRVRALEEMRRKRRERRAAPGKVRLEIQAGQRSGELVAEVEAVSLSFGDLNIVRRFSTTILRGDRVGIIGPNGVGKTTLVRLLLGQLPPDEGTVRLGTNLQIAYFDQLREQLDEDRTVQENAGGGRDSVQIGGRSRHIVGYLRDFLFSPDRARTPVRLLSGGERNRLLLARLFTRPANLIVLDEPTNDLDTETLELLEDCLAEFDGTVLLVSHDRAFLNNVVTSTIVFEEEGVREYFGGYDDWLAQRANRPASPTPGSPVTSRRDRRPARSRERRLTFNEKRELAGLPDEIERLESEISELHGTMADPALYRQAGDRVAEMQTRLRTLETRVAMAYERWQELEALQG